MAILAEGPAKDRDDILYLEHLPLFNPDGTENKGASLNDTIIILDFGGQYTQLIARRVRQAKVLSQVLPFGTSAEDILALNPRGIILSGGPASVLDEGAPRCDPRVFALGIPVLGICYGMQLMGVMLGGSVKPAIKREYGLQDVQLDNDFILFKGLAARQGCWMSHTYQVEGLPKGFSAKASTDTCCNAAMADETRRLYGLQFHPEVTHTRQGMAMLRAFLYDICGCRGDWEMADFAKRAVEDIQAAVGNGTVLLALSGGVDSSVVAALLYRAIGDRLHCVFVDHGFMRKDEPEMVKAVFGRNFPVSLTAVDAARRFMEKLKGVADPESKRKIIGAEFIAVFREEAAKLGHPGSLCPGYHLSRCHRVRRCCGLHSDQEPPQCGRSSQGTWIHQPY